MRFIRHHSNGLTTFKLVKHASELRGALPGDKWIVVDESSSLQELLCRYEMLDFTKTELLAAQMLASKNALWRKSESSRSYCRKQASLIPAYADEAIERVASQIVAPHEFKDLEYGISPWIRRLTLAFAQELGSNI